jgi:cyclophilin family peptidyl-prolyl cis-trans isomerase
MYSSRVLVTLILVVFSLATLGCGSSQEPPAASISSGTSSPHAGTKGVTEPVTVVANAACGTTPSPRRWQPPVAPEVLLKTNLGEIRLRLNAQQSPVTVDNFLANYVDRGFYDQTVFHYVEPGFMIAGGGYTPELTAKEPRAAIKNEAGNGLRNLRGTVAMARQPEYADSATSQFFINLVDNPSLDQQNRDSNEGYGYCVFGEVVAGMDVVERIAAVPTTDNSRFPKTPANPVIVQAATRVR